MSTLRNALPLVFALALVACSPLKPPAVTAPAAAVKVPATTAAAVVARQVAVKKTTVERLAFTVDSERSSGEIVTTLDPHRLGPRTSTCTCPLSGSLVGELTTRPDGSRSLRLDRIDLATTSDGHLHYDWSPLIGNIKTVIPAGVLTISRHSIPGPLVLDRGGSFARHGHKFKVGGTAKVVGKGLLLTRKVGHSEEDLTINPTGPVKLEGTLLRRNGRWVLHLPSAIMKDRFDLDDDGSTMDLNFTANITAIAP